MLLGKHILERSSGPSIPIGETFTFTSSIIWEVPSSGIYEITLVGGGGKGGSGGKTYSLSGSDRLKGGGGGGGGGAAPVTIKNINLTRGDSINISIASAGGTSKFGSYFSASPGKNGGDASYSTGGTGGWSGGNGETATKYEGKNGGNGQTGYGSGVRASNGVNPGTNTNLSSGSGGTGGSGYGAGGGGGGGVPAAQDRAIGQGGNGSSGVAIIKYLNKN